MSKNSMTHEELTTLRTLYKKLKHCYFNIGYCYPEMEIVQAMWEGFDGAQQNYFDRECRCHLGNPPCPRCTFSFEEWFQGYSK